MHVDTTIKLVDRCEGFSGILAVNLQTGNNLGMLITAALPFRSCGGIYGGHDTRRSAGLLYYCTRHQEDEAGQYSRLHAVQSPIGYDK